MNICLKNIRFCLLNVDNDKQLRALYNWDSDPEISALVIPNQKTVTEKEKVTYEDFSNRYIQSKDYANGLYLIYDGNKEIGYFSITLNPKHLMKNQVSTSWLGLTIGDKSYWGSGVAKLAMEYFEKLSMQKGAQRVELGTFAFNHRAKAFYTKLGYKEIGRLKDFTFWQGKFWDDIRMEKFLK